jgi:type IV pilus assembly protein PilC
MLFTYQARDLTGKIRDGEISAASEAEATRQLRQDGMYLLSMAERKGAANVPGLELFQRRIRRGEIIYLTNQLSIMIDAGVPLASALEGLARQTDNPTLQRVLKSLQKDVESGEPLSAALARFPRHFDRTYVNLVKASEASGTLGKMLERIATQTRSELETRQQVLGAMMYPGAMVVMCVGVSIFLLTYVFPKITPMFATKGIKLPTPTRVMMVLSDALTHHWYWFILGVIALTGGFLYARRQRWGRVALDWTWLHLPILGSVIRKVTISRSLRTLATTINAGVPMLEALQLSGGVSNNIFYEETWNQVADQVTSGKQIYEALEGNKLFPSTLLQMISSGESTGKLGQVLNKVSDYYDREVATSIKSATSMIEPVMVAVMGGVIGTIALAMLLPIFTLSSHVG